MEGETGALFDPGDIETLATHLVRVGSSPDERKRLGANGRARARERFAWSRIADDTIALYRHLLETAS